MSYALGLDVSRYQNIPDWSKVPAEREFVYVQAAFAETGRDSSFAQHFDGARASGRYVAPYLFCNMAFDPLKQAQNLFNAVGGRKIDLPPMMDVESNTNLPPSVIDQFIVSCSAEIERLFGEKPGLYSYPNYEQTEIRPGLTAENQYPIGRLWFWPADYSKGSRPSASQSPIFVAPWDSWLVWQVSGDKGPLIPGIGVCDQDVFNGDSAALAQFVANRELGNASTSPPPSTAVSAFKALAVTGAVAGLGYAAYKYAPGIRRDYLSPSYKRLREVFQ